MTREAPDRRPRLLVLASTYPRWSGDPEPGFVHELAKRLTDGFDVLALAPHSPCAKQREILDGVDVIRYRYAPERFETLVNDGGIVANLKRSRWKYLLLPGFVVMQAWVAWRLLRSRSVDVIHAHWLLPQGLVAVLLRWLPGKAIPYLVTSHGADLYALRGPAMDVAKRLVSRRASAVTVVSEAMRVELDRLGVERDRVEVRPMGVDLSDRFTPDPAAERSCDEILFVGRLVEKKGVRYLIDAMPRILSARPSAVLAIAGFGPEETVLRQQAIRLGVQDKVRFLGAVAQPELPGLYRRAALFVAPFVQAKSGDQEGLGLVLVEAIGCGCPIIAGEVAALAELLGDGHDEMRVNPHDVDVLASRIIDVLADPVAARERAMSLRGTLCDKFDWGRVCDAYAALLRSAAGEAAT